MKVWISTFFLLLLYIWTALKFATKVPYIYFFMAILSALIITFAQKRVPQKIRLISLNLAVAVLTMLVFEAFFACQDLRLFQHKKTIHIGTWKVRDAVRGYAPVVGRAREKKMLKDGRTIFDVIYTNNVYGLRIAPHDIYNFPFKSGFKDVIFFGCSFTYGEGVNDDESLPFLFEDKGQGKYKAYNFGFVGYGPQQMLRILESSMIDNIVSDKKPFIAIYQAMPDHVSRCALKYPAVMWYNGPGYGFDKKGKLIFRKSLRDSENPVVRRLVKSYLFKKIYCKPNDNDVKIFMQVVLKSKTLVEDKYRGMFYMLFWDNDSRLSKKILEALSREQIRVILVSQILGNLADEKIQKKYKIIEDGHPNRVAYGRIAEYLLKYL